MNNLRPDRPYRELYKNLNGRIIDTDDIYGFIPSKIKDNNIYTIRIDKDTEYCEDDLINVTIEEFTIIQIQDSIPDGTELV